MRCTSSSSTERIRLPPVASRWLVAVSMPGTWEPDASRWTSASTACSLSCTRGSADSGTVTDRTYLATPGPARDPPRERGTDHAVLPCDPARPT